METEARGVVTAARGGVRAPILAHRLEELRAGGAAAARAAVATTPRRVYAFCRRADDASTWRAGPAAPRAPLSGCAASWTRRTRAQRRPTRCWRAFQDVVRRRAIPRATRTSCSPGMAMDVARRALRDAGRAAALLLPRGGHRRADDVPRDGRARRARRCGSAADLGIGDAAHQHLPRRRRGLAARPRSTCRRSCSTPPRADAASDARSRSPRPRTAVKRLLAIGADASTARATRAWPALPLRCALAVRAARLIYAAIGRQIARVGFDVRAGRAVVPRRAEAVAGRACRRADAGGSLVGASRGWSHVGATAHAGRSLRRWPPSRPTSAGCASSGASTGSSTWRGSA